MDSTAILTAANLGLQAQLEVAKQTINAQQNLTTTSITVLALVVAVLAGATWLWNFVLNKREIRSQIRRAEQSLADSTRKLIGDEMAKLSVAHKAEFEQRILVLDAERARSFVLANMQLKAWDQACDHGVVAIEMYARSKMDQGLRTSVDGLKLSLGNCTWLSAPRKEAIRAAMKWVPLALKPERDAIEEKLNALPESEPPTPTAVSAPQGGPKP